MVNHWPNPLGNELDAAPLPLTKGLPVMAVGLSPSDAADQNWALFDEELMLPVAVLRESAIVHNIRAMAAYCRECGVFLCPHAKTTLAPQLFAQQLNAGAWGLTAATAAHLMLYRRAGVQRVFFANPLVDAAAIKFVAAEMKHDRAFEFHCLIDSVEGLELLNKALAKAGSERPVGVLIEMGAAGGRLGVRSVSAGLELARRASRLRGRVELTGVSAFEGIFSLRPGGDDRGVERMLGDLALLGESIDREGLWAHRPPLVSAGGSLYFREVVDALRRLPFPSQIVLRSGCYIAHDHHMYASGQRAHLEQSSITPGGQPRVEFDAAVEVWGQVLSRPECGLALASFGKRDVSYDLGLPIPMGWYRRGTHNVPQPLSGVEVTALNDQHAYLRLPKGLDLAVGDYVGVGISHPCTTFDKWRVLLMVDDHYRVVATIRTYF